MTIKETKKQPTAVRVRRMVASELPTELNTRSGIGVCWLVNDIARRRGYSAAYAITLMREYIEVTDAREGSYGYNDIPTDTWRTMTADERHAVRAKRVAQYVAWVERCKKAGRLLPTKDEVTEWLPRKPK